MAFQFTPPFEEGDKETNPETGVEYIFTGGAWRPLGPKIEDEFDTLDERYVNVSGDTIQGELFFDFTSDGRHNLGLTPGRDNTAIIFSMNGGTTRLRSLVDNNTGSSNVRTHFGWGRDNAGNPQTVLYHLSDPGDSHHAVNLSYLESYVAEQLESVDLDGYATEDYVDTAVADYLPLTGGDMTGPITIDMSLNQAIIISKDGQENLKFWVDGTASTTKTTFNDDNFVTKAYVDNNLSNYISKSGENVVASNWKIKSSNRTFVHNDSNSLGLYHLKAPNESHHAARKQDVDYKVPGRFYVSNGSLYYEN